MNENSQTHKKGGVRILAYKICLISTHGTGKTALAGMIEGELKRRGIEALSIREMSTKARERGLPINEQTTISAQLWILHTQFAEELLYSQKRPNGHNYDVIICDRGPDNYCYLQQWFGDDPHALQLTLGHLKKFPYSRIFLLPIVDDTITDDGGTRALDVTFQQVMDTKIRTFMNDHQLSFIELPRPNQEDNFRNEWVKIIVNQTLQDLKVPEKYWMR